MGVHVKDSDELGGDDFYSADDYREMVQGE